MFTVLTELVDFVWKAIQVYAASDEGRAELNEILDAVEAAGIDIPFYEPTGETGEGGDVGDIGSNGESDLQAERARKFAERHPELAGEH